MRKPVKRYYAHLSSALRAIKRSGLKRKPTIFREFVEGRMCYSVWL